jgi:UDP-N-acetylmuramoyl-tripeptide--D-alanyl-D-alanine ligase
MIKKFGKTILCILLERQVKQLRKKNKFTVIAVGGSVGKTSTKLAIAKLLESKARVQYQDGNYNDRLTVPLVIFGEIEPSIFNVWAWLKLLSRNRKALKQPYPYEYAVLELGTDGPGQMADFAYLKPEMYVLTAIAIEHIEYFKTLDAIAVEETAPFAYAQKVLVNIDDVDANYLSAKTYDTYGKDGSAENSYEIDSDGRLHVFMKPTSKLTVDSPLLGSQGAKAVLAAATVAHYFGWDVDAIANGIGSITPVSGRMQLLEGRNGSAIIDDTYNASPVAVRAALDVLYVMPQKYKIAILGSMNELGDESQAAHEEIGAYCDPHKLSLVITVGNAAKEYLAPAAQAAGCTVQSFLSPYEAGNYATDFVTSNTAVLAKGSQNGVFAEEAIKPLLADKTDALKLVRQSPYWMHIKKQQFPESVSDPTHA